MFAVRSRLRALRDEHGRRALGQGAVGRLLFGWANRGKSPVYLAYRPDSQFIFHSHTEADAVMDRWLAGNSIYNGGDLPRLYSLVLNIKQTIADNVPGDFAELGVYKGNTAAVLCDLAAACGRRVFLFDTFSGFDDRDLDLETNPCEHQFGDTSIDFVRRTVGHSDCAEYVVGRFPDSLTAAAESARFAFVHLDCDLFGPTEAGLNFFYPRVSHGGTIVIHDYSSGHWPGVKQAVDEFCRRTGERVVLLPDKSGSAIVRKIAH